MDNSPHVQLGQQHFVRSIESVDHFLHDRVHAVQVTRCCCANTASYPPWRCSRDRSSYRQGTISLCSLAPCTLLALVARCLLCFCSLSWSIHREKCSTLPPCQRLHSALHQFRCSQPLRTSVSFCFLFCTSDVGSMQVVECGVHGQQNTNPANLQRCSSTEGETGLVPTSVQSSAAGTK